ncbi:MULTISPECIES: hypothetical protein [unclassified Streptomyces]|uniref:hypothetical protein n=1 Tax=unclassified Streptomyces TaxID=2593676 RepID=UPI00081F0031|nr:MULTISPECIES: hypothetical protein [unclassified Streptomyces]MYZ36507.1 hypothetical protein [Streptomyces sp. SID4917]SCF84149.1 hypothetical protein GA0115259_103475 [Streptomyces sp. MnatMP-M17]
MASNQQTRPQPGRFGRDSKTDADLLHALFAAGGYWGLTPDWVPRGGYATPCRNVLRRLETALLIDSAPRPGEEW